ncbi:MAG: hypothetical protein OEU40_02080, partial [Gammaproteobacteria bacterium]|nr:hypothetical protein [Gammaproteobacteria bacterium]
VGGVEVNSAIAMRRAEAIAAVLVDQGWGGTIVTLESPLNETDSPIIDPGMRRAVVELQSIDLETTQ